MTLDCAHLLDIRTKPDCQPGRNANVCDPVAKFETHYVAIQYDMRALERQIYLVSTIRTSSLLQFGVVVLDVSVTRQKFRRYEIG